MTIPAVPWWPPVGSHEITDFELRQLFGYLRTITPPVMRDAHRRILEHVGDDPIRVDYVTVMQVLPHRRRHRIVLPGCREGDGARQRMG